MAAKAVAEKFIELSSQIKDLTVEIAKSVIAGKTQGASSKEPIGQEAEKPIKKFDFREHGERVTERGKSGFADLNKGGNAAEMAKSQDFLTKQLTNRPKKDNPS